MAYQEIKTTSYGTRLKNSFGGIFSGIILFIAASALLWWNEGRAVKTTKMLNDAQGNYTELTDINNVDPQYEGKLVHATGLAATTDTLIDPIFGIKDLAISLVRDVEYYQWKEKSTQQKKDKLGGGEETITTYTYEKNWVSQPVSSDSFHDPEYKEKNFVLMDISDNRQYAENVTFGAYRLTKSQTASLPADKSVIAAMPEEIVKQLDREAKLTYRHHASPDDPYVRNEYKGSQLAADLIDKVAEQAADTLRNVINENSTAKYNYNAEFIHISGNTVYIGLTPNAPRVGDIRITFTKATPEQVSLLACVVGNTFSNYTAKNGKTFSALTTGSKTADEMFETQHQGNKTWTWILRIAGLLLVIAGLKGIFNFLETIMKVVPFLAGILGFGVSLVCSVVGFVWSLIIIALAWIFYRPALGIALLAVAVAVIFFASKKGKELIAQHLSDKSDKTQPETK